MNAERWDGRLRTLASECSELTWFPRARWDGRIRLNSSIIVDQRDAAYAHEARRCSSWRRKWGSLWPAPCSTIRRKKSPRLVSPSISTSAAHAPWGRGLVEESWFDGPIDDPV